MTETRLERVRKLIENYGRAKYADGTREIMASDESLDAHAALDAELVRLAEDGDATDWLDAKVAAEEGLVVAYGSAENGDTLFVLYDERHVADFGEGKTLRAAIRAARTASPSETPIRGAAHED